MKSNLKEQVNSVVLVLISLAALVPAVAFAQAAGIQHKFDWTIQVETEKLDNYLQFTGSSLNPVIMARVSYAQGSLNDNNAIQYEQFFFRGDDVIGCRKQHTLDLGSGGQTVLFVLKHKAGAASDPSEGAAGIDAVVRLMLEARLKKLIPMSVIVPQDSFASAEDGLKRLKFYALSQGFGNAASLIQINILSDPPGLDKTYGYQENQH